VTASGDNRNGRPALVALSLAFFIVLFDATSVGVGLPAIARGVGIRTADMQWVLIAFNVPSASLLLAGGALGDRFGQRRIFAVGLGVFAAAACAASAAPSAEVMLLARSFQGVGAAMLVPTSLALLGHTFRSARQQATAMGVWVGVGGVAGVVGPLCGGLVVDAIGWRSIFALGAPAALVALFLALRYIEETAPDRTRPLDWAGQVLALAALATTCLVVTRAPTWGWTSGRFALGSSAALALAGALLAIELRSASPMLVLREIPFRPVGAAALINLLYPFAAMGGYVVLLLHLQRELGLSASATGAVLMPGAAASALAAFASGSLVSRLGARWVAMGGTLVGSVGACTILAALVVPTVPVIVVGTSLMGAGSLVSPTMTSIALRSVDRSRLGATSGLFSVCRQVGAVLGIATLGAVYASSGSRPLVPTFLACAGVFALARIFAGRAIGRRGGSPVGEPPTSEMDRRRRNGAGAGVTRR
jgi:DHA2 family methylenomycin A resistance protein-like MFS transporter